MILFSLLQSLAVLTGFIAVIRPASSISCYVKDCTYYPDDEPYCRDSGLVDCLEEDDDRCGTLSFTLGSNIGVKVWNCTRSTHDDCNEQVTCDHMRKLAVDIDDTIESCAVTCCEGDECNDPGKMEEHMYVTVHVCFIHCPIFFHPTYGCTKNLHKTKAAGVYCMCYPSGDRGQLNYP